MSVASTVPAPVPAASSRPARPELLAPAGDWECARAAIENGADAIYFGLERFNARMRAKNFTQADLPALKDVLQKMKANAKAVTDVVASQTALATGEADILIGGGEWVTAGIAKENPDLDFSIPKEGAVLWSQSLAMFKDSKNKDNALKFIQYVMSPEGQARLATSSCYWGMPASKAAALDADQKKILRFDEQADFLKRAQEYPAPSEDLDKKMQDLWTAMIQGQ